MQRLDDLNRRLGIGSGVGRKLTFFSDSIQGSLGDIGGEPLAESGFDNEQPEPEFDPGEEES